MMGPRRPFARNPFLVLELPVTASTIEVERQGRKWLGLIPLGSERAKEYPSPIGPQLRDETLVRAAMAELKDATSRVVAEFEARALAYAVATPDTHAIRWPEADALRPLRRPG